MSRMVLTALLTSDPLHLPPYARAHYARARKAVNPRFASLTGRPVPGYAAAEFWLRKEAALALAAAQTDALKQGVSTRRLRLLSSAAGN
jgi:hypothetical protein